MLKFIFLVFGLLLLCTSNAQVSFVYTNDPEHMQCLAVDYFSNGDALLVIKSRSDTMLVYPTSEEIINPNPSFTSIVFLRMNQAQEVVWAQFGEAYFNPVQHWSDFLHEGCTLEISENDEIYFGIGHGNSYQFGEFIQANSYIENYSLIKLSSEGQFEWVKDNTLSFPGEHYIADIQIIDGRIFFSAVLGYEGEYDGVMMNGQLVIVEVDSNGNYLNHIESGGWILSEKDGRLLSLGRGQYLTEFDLNLNEVQSLNLWNYDPEYSVGRRMASDGEMVFFSYITNIQNYHATIVATNENLEEIWTAQLESTHYLSGLYVVDDIVMAIYYSDTCAGQSLGIRTFNKLDGTPLTHDQNGINNQEVSSGALAHDSFFNGNQFGIVGEFYSYAPTLWNNQEVEFQRSQGSGFFYTGEISNLTPVNIKEQENTILSEAYFTENGQLNINCSSPESSKAFIYNLQGTLINTFDFNCSNFKSDKTFSVGAYIVQVISQNSIETRTLFNGQ